jgi:hypothetical protein
MLLEPVLIDSLSADISRVIKFGCVNADKLQCTYFATDYNKNDGTFYDAVREVRYTLHNDSCIILYIQESEINFDKEIKKIKKYHEEYKDIYAQNFSEYVLASVDASIPVVNRCRLFEYHNFISARDLDAAFFECAKQKWKVLIDERKKQIVDLLTVDKEEFVKALNQEGVDEVQDILNVLDREYEAVVVKIENAVSYHDLIKIWPAILLPRPKAA